MRIVLTGASGRIGRAIHARLSREHDVIGLDQRPSETTRVVATLADVQQVKATLQGAQAVIHAAALHAPHVGVQADAEFEAVNVTGTETLLRLAIEAGVRHFVFTSTTALYGEASTPVGRAGWVTEETPPEPRTIYHRTKLRAERLLESAAASSDMSITVIRMSRCFPEAAPAMAVYRLHRGIDARDVAHAHAAALAHPVAGWRRFIISGASPFLPEDVTELASNAPAVIWRRAPDLADEFLRRRWRLPSSIDRVYWPAKAMAELAWTPQHGYAEVLAQLDRGSPDVLAPDADGLLGD